MAAVVVLLGGMVYLGLTLQSANQRIDDLRSDLEATRLHTSDLESQVESLHTELEDLRNELFQGTSVFDLVVGDCFNDEPNATDSVSEVPTVDCSQPHDNEIYFEFSMTDSAFPGQEATRNSSAERCIAEFEAFVGLSYEESDLDIFPITPTATSWEQGDRVVYCVLYALDLSKLTGSMRGAAR